MAWANNWYGRLIANGGKFNGGAALWQIAGIVRGSVIRGRPIRRIDWSKVDRITIPGRAAGCSKMRPGFRRWLLGSTVFVSSRG